VFLNYSHYAVRLQATALKPNLPTSLYYPSFNGSRRMLRDHCRQSKVPDSLTYELSLTSVALHLVNHLVITRRVTRFTCTKVS
jgi:hypothetical protein